MTGLLCMDSNGLTAYRQAQNNAQVAIADPHKLIQLLFNELMISLARAKGSIERQQHEAKGQEISHCVEILLTLDSSLNMEIGGDLAANLRSLYHYSVRELLVAGHENGVEKVDEVVALMKQIQEAWDAAGQQMAQPAGATDNA